MDKWAAVITQGELRARALAQRLVHEEDVLLHEANDLIKQYGSDVRELRRPARLLRRSRDAASRAPSNGPG